MNPNVYNCLICFNPVTIEIINVQNSIQGYNLNVHSAIHSLFNVKIDFPQIPTTTTDAAGTNRPLESLPAAGCIFNTSPKLQNIGSSLGDTKICLTCTNYCVELLQTFNELKIIQHKLMETKGKVCEHLSSSYTRSHCHQEMCQTTKNTRDEIVQELSNLGIIKINSFENEPLVKPQVVTIQSEIKAEPIDEMECHVDSYLDDNDGDGAEPAAEEDNFKIMKDVRGYPVFPCPYPYEECSQTFQCIEFLETHLRVTHFRCMFCKQYFSSSKELAKHKIKIHRKFRCDVKGCGNKFYSILKLTNHSKIHENMPQNQNEKKFECNICQGQDGKKKSFSSKTSLKNHMETHSTEYTFKCTEPDCHYMSKTRATLRNHIRVIHEHKPYNKPKKITDHKSIVCHECGKSISEKGYENHLKTHLPQEQRPRPFSCTKCSKSFLGKPTLRSHVRFVHNLTGHVCALCGNLVKHIQSHLKQAHGQEKIKCTVCSNSRTFKSFVHLRRHMKCHNPEIERKFKCSFVGCNKAFKTQSDLNCHTNVHTKEKKKSCPHCDKVFIHPDNLRIHIATLHSDKRDFICEVDGCGESFKIKRYLTLHTKKIHEMSTSN